MVAHLEAQVCPSGTKVWPVQNDGWLAACINCGAAGMIRINTSKTDYIVLTQGAWVHLEALQKEGIQITGQHLIEQLPQVIALYEVREPHGQTCQFMCSHLVCTTAFQPLLLAKRPCPNTRTLEQHVSAGCEVPTLRHAPVVLIIACHICSGQDNNIPEEGTGKGRAPGGMSPPAVSQCTAAAQLSALLTRL